MANLTCKSRTNTNGASLWVMLLMTSLYMMSQVAVAMTTDGYYSLSREWAVVNHESEVDTMILSPGEQHDVSEEYNSRPLSLTEVHERYVERTVTTLRPRDTTCPGMANATLRHTCPTYTVAEYDPYRLPNVLIQVRCRCLHCLGPFADRSANRCTPLFQFVNVIRIMEITPDGERRYAQVQEPVSHACVCARSLARRIRFVMPP